MAILDGFFQVFAGSLALFIFGNKKNMQWVKKRKSPCRSLNKITGKGVQSGRIPRHNP